jgi:hypothetical protein
MQKTQTLKASTELVARAMGPRVVDRVLAIAPVALLHGEKEADYVCLAERLIGAAKPKDVIEELLTRDVIDLTWEIFRLRRVKGGILKASMNTGVIEVLKGLGHGSELSFGYREELGKKWAAGDKNARKEVDTALAKAGMTIDR